MIDKFTKEEKNNESKCFKLIYNVYSYERYKQFLHLMTVIFPAWNSFAQLGHVAL